MANLSTVLAINFSLPFQVLENEWRVSFQIPEKQRVYSHFRVSKNAERKTCVEYLQTSAFFQHLKR